MKRSRLLLVVIVIAVAGLSISLWVGEGPLWRWVMLRRMPLQSEIDGHEVVEGWILIHRWTGERHGRAIGYFEMAMSPERLGGSMVVC